jgi:transposase
LKPVWAGEQAVTAVWREREEGKPQQIAEGYERQVTLSREVAGRTISWTERQLIVRSHKLATAATQALHARLTKAQAQLEGLSEHKQGKKRYADGAALQQAAQAILKQHRLEGLLQVSVEEQVQERPVRAYGDRPAGVRVECTLRLHTVVDDQAVAAAVRRLGWRVYVTNHPTEGLSLSQAVLAYRAEYLVEHGFGRVIGKPLSLSPMYVQSDQRATGLVRLLSIGLRVLTLLEFRVRQRLADQQEHLAGLYAGNPKRSTQRPTAEALLGAFQGIHLSLITLGQQLHRHLTPLSALQQRILSLLDFSSDLYDQLLC